MVGERAERFRDAVEDREAARRELRLADLEEHLVDELQRDALAVTFARRLELADVGRDALAQARRKSRLLLFGLLYARRETIDVGSQALAIRGEDVPMAAIICARRAASPAFRSLRATDARSATTSARVWRSATTVARRCPRVGTPYTASEAVRAKSAHPRCAAPISFRLVGNASMSVTFISRAVMFTPPATPSALARLYGARPRCRRLQRRER